MASDRAGEIDCEEQVISLGFHPSFDVLAASLVTGVVQLWRYPPAEQASGSAVSAAASAEPELALSLGHHSKSCREAIFSPDGSLLFTGSADRSVCAVDTNGAVAWRQADAHAATVNCLLCLSAQLLVSGDEDGCLRVWDVRQQRCVAEAHEQTDFVADLALHSERDRLLCASGDGTLGVYDMRRGRLKLVGRSDEQEDELLSIAILKNGQKVVVGTQEGVLSIWSWDAWGDISDRFPGHPESVDALLKIDEDTVCTGSSDGLIRIVSIHPNKLLGVVGDHDDFPVECLRISRDRQLLGSTSHDTLVRLWDVSYFLEDDDGDEGDDGAAAASEAVGEDEAMEEEDSREPSAAGSRRGKDRMRPATKQQQAESFFSDM